MLLLDCRWFSDLRIFPIGCPACKVLQPLFPCVIIFSRNFAGLFPEGEEVQKKKNSDAISVLKWGCHDRLLMQCAPCGGQMMCHHGRQRYQCRDCGGGRICPHQKRKDSCNWCGSKPVKQISTLRALCFHFACFYMFFLHVWLVWLGSP